MSAGTSPRYSWVHSDDGPGRVSIVQKETFIGGVVSQEPPALVFYGDSLGEEMDIVAATAMVAEVQAGIVKLAGMKLAGIGHERAAVRRAAESDPAGDRARDTGLRPNPEGSAAGAPSWSGCASSGSRWPVATLRSSGPHVTARTPADLTRSVASTG